MGMFLLAAALVVTTAQGAAHWKIEETSEMVRPMKCDSLSSLCHLSNDVYLSCSDWSPTICELELPVGADGKLKACKLRELVKPEQAQDVEGLAYDPRDGSVWLADEINTRVDRYDLASGKRLEGLDLPAVMKKTRFAVGIESLTIGPDGNEMWLANEEALECDGPRSSNADGTNVRLTKFRRGVAGGKWKAEGQWIYHTDPVAGGAFKWNGHNRSRSGVSSICILHDGTMLILEREFSLKILPMVRCRIYEVDFDGAENVIGKGGVKTEKDARYVKKTLLFEKNGFYIYEGLSEGPKLKDGGRVLAMVSDGDKKTLGYVCVMKISRIMGNGE